MKTLLLVAWFFPLFAFCIAAITELRSTAERIRKFRNLIPILLGIAAFGLSIHPGRLLPLTPSSSVTLSRFMTLFSATIASSGVFISYSRNSSAVWVALGGLVLTVVWMFNIIHV